MIGGVPDTELNLGDELLIVDDNQLESSCLSLMDQRLSGTMNSSSGLNLGYASKGATAQAKTISRVSKRLVDLENLLADNIDNLTSQQKYYD